MRLLDRSASEADKKKIHERLQNNLRTNFPIIESSARSFDFEPLFQMTFTILITFPQFFLNIFGLVRSMTHKRRRNI